MGRKLLLKDEAGLLQFRAAIADGDAKRARAVMKEFGPSSLTADQISGAVRYQMRLQKKREAEAKAEAIAIAAASRATSHRHVISCDSSQQTLPWAARASRAAPRPAILPEAHTPTGCVHREDRASHHDSPRLIMFCCAQCRET